MASDPNRAGPSSSPPEGHETEDSPPCSSTYSTLVTRLGAKELSDHLLPPADVNQMTTPVNTLHAPCANPDTSQLHQTHVTSLVEVATSVKFFHERHHLLGIITCENFVLHDQQFKLVDVSCCVELEGPSYNTLSASHRSLVHAYFRKHPHLAHYCAPEWGLPSLSSLLPSSSGSRGAHESLELPSVTCQADIYSIGVLIREVVLGHDPSHGFGGPQPSSSSLLGPPVPTLASLIDRALLELSRLCCLQDPTQRPTIAQVVKLLELCSGLPSRPTEEFQGLSQLLSSSSQFGELGLLLLLTNFAEIKEVLKKLFESQEVRDTTQEVRDTAQVATEEIFRRIERLEAWTHSMSLKDFADHATSIVSLKEQFFALKEDINHLIEGNDFVDQKLTKFLESLVKRLSTVEAKVGSPSSPPRFPVPSHFMSSEINPLKSAQCVGRSETAEKIQQKLASSSNAVIVVHGKGGMGKTMIMRKLAASMYDCQNYTHVFWINGETPQSFENSLTAIVQQFYPSSAWSAQPITLFESLLRTIPKYLLVVDNADAPSPLKGYLNSLISCVMQQAEPVSLSTQRHLLITSRLGQPMWGKFGIQCYYNLEALDASSSELLLWKIATGFNGSEEDALRSLADLKASHPAEARALSWLCWEEFARGHPLILKTLANWIKNGTTSLEANNRFSLCQRALEDSKQVAKQGLIERDQVPILRLLQLSMDHLFQKKESKACVDLLYLCCFLFPDDISISFLVRCATYLPEDSPLRQALQREHSPSGLDGTMTSLIHQLCSFCLLEVVTDKEGKYASVSIHRLVQRVLRDQLCNLYNSKEPQVHRRGALLAYIRACFRALDENTHDSSSKDGFQYIESLDPLILSHSTALWSMEDSVMIAMIQDTETSHCLVRNVRAFADSFSFRFFEFDLTIASLRTLISFWKAHSLNQAEFLTLGALYLNFGLMLIEGQGYNEAIDALLTASSLHPIDFERGFPLSFGSMSPEQILSFELHSAVSYHLGEAYLRSHQPELAMMAFKKCVAICKLLDDPRISPVYMGLGDCWLLQGNFEQALMMYNEAAEEPYTSSSGFFRCLVDNAQGAVMYHQKNMAASKKQFSKALRTAQAHQAKTSNVVSTTAKIKSNLVIAEVCLLWSKDPAQFFALINEKGHSLLEQLDEALASLKDAYSTLSVPSRHVADCLSNKGALLLLCGKVSEALECFKEAASMLSKLSSESFAKRDLKNLARRVQFLVAHCKLALSPEDEQFLSFLPQTHLDEGAALDEGAVPSPQPSCASIPDTFVLFMLESAMFRTYVLDVKVPETPPNLSFPNPPSLTRFASPEITHQSLQTCIGRAQSLEDIAGCFGRLPVSVLHGLPGIGKTALAKLFAFLNWQSRHYDHLLWINAESLQTFIDSINKLVELLGINPSNKKINYRRALQLFQQWLESSHNYLILIDNVDSPSSVNSHLESILSSIANSASQSHQVRHHILITSRVGESGWTDYGPMQFLNVRSLDLPRSKFMLWQSASGFKGPENEGLNEFSLFTSKYSEEANSISWLCENFAFGHPLAIQNLAKWIKECTTSGQTNRFSACKQALIEQGLQMLKGSPQERERVSIHGVFQLSIRHLLLGDETKPSVDLLYLCCFLFPDAISVDFLIKCALYLPEDNPLRQALQREKTPTGRVATMTKLVNKLHSFNLLEITTDGDGKSASVSIHRLVQRVLRDKLLQQYNSLDAKSHNHALLHCVRACFRALDEDFQQNLFSNEPMLSPCEVFAFDRMVQRSTLLHTNALCSLEDDILIAIVQDEETSRCLVRNIRCFTNSFVSLYFDFQHTLKTRLHILEIWRQYGNPKNTFNLGGLLLNMGILLFEENRYDEAVAKLQEAKNLNPLNIEKMTFPLPQDEVAWAQLYSSLLLFEAAAEAGRGRYEEARVLYSDSCKLRRYLKDARRVAALIGEGDTYCRLRRFNEALKSYCEAADFAKISLEEGELVSSLQESESTFLLRSILYHAKALVHYKKGDYETSRVFFGRALSLVKESRPGEPRIHPLVAKILNNLGNNYLARALLEIDDAEESRALLKRAAELYHESISNFKSFYPVVETSLTLSRTLSNEAVALIYLGQYHRAFENLAEASLIVSNLSRDSFVQRKELPRLQIKLQLLVGMMKQKLTQEETRPIFDAWIQRLQGLLDFRSDHGKEVLGAVLASLHTLVASTPHEIQVPNIIASLRSFSLLFSAFHYFPLPVPSNEPILRSLDQPRNDELKVFEREKVDDVVQNNPMDPSEEDLRSLHQSSTADEESKNTKREKVDDGVPIRVIHRLDPGEEEPCWTLLFFTVYILSMLFLVYVSASFKNPARD